MIRRLTLTDFRNYYSLDLHLDPYLNLLWGPNGAGKTNILEAVYLLGLVKSPRGARDRDLIAWGREAYRVGAEVSRGRSSFRLEIFFHRERGKGARINGVPQSRPSDVLASLSVVLFSPDDLALIKGGPAERRSFLDQQISQADPRYYQALARYSRVLAQRNQALKAPSGATQLAGSFDDQLVQAGSYLLKRRLEALPTLSSGTASWVDNLSGGEDQAEVSYAGSIQIPPEADDDSLRASFHEALSRVRGEELGRGHTVVGPHRDDLAVSLNGRDSRVYSSQGQKRTLALGLKLQQVGYLERAMGHRPVLLLDDVLSELDSRRRAVMIRALKQGGQTLITSTDPEELGAGGLFQVEDGRVTVREAKSDDSV